MLMLILQKIPSNSDKPPTDPMASFGLSRSPISPVYQLNLGLWTTSLYRCMHSNSTPSETFQDTVGNPGPSASQSGFPLSLQAYAPQNCLLAGTFFEFKLDTSRVKYLIINWPGCLAARGLVFMQYLPLGCTRYSSSTHISYIQMDADKQEYYDSDIASVNNDDFLSDNEPPKELVGDKRIIKKEKFRRVYKSLYKLGYHSDKPAPFDRVVLKYAHHNLKPQTYTLEGDSLTYNLGLNQDYKSIEELVTSMSNGEAAVFQIQHLKMCDQTNIKVLDRTEFYIIDLISYTTVIDLDNDKTFMKEVQTKGEGHFRVSECDQAIWEYSVTSGDKEVKRKYQQPVDITEKLIQQMPRSVWRLLQTMKAKETSFLEFGSQAFQKVEGSDFHDQLIDGIGSSQKVVVRVHVQSFTKVDDICFTQKLLRKTVRKGNSTNKASDGSVVYYCVGFYGPDGSIVQQDKNFELDVDDLTELSKLQCRSHHLDDQSCSQMLKNILVRTKPLQIAQFKCHDKSMIQYGWDYEELIRLFGAIPDVTRMKIKVFNFTQEKTAYNTTVDQKVCQSQRKKPFGLKSIEKGDFKKAREVFQSIIYLFDYGVDSEEDKQKVQAVKLSTLMNCSLCNLKLGEYLAVIELCKSAKEIKYSQKCAYRLASSYKHTGEAQKGLEELQEWSKVSILSQQMEALKAQLETDLAKYNKKSKTLYSNMFG